ncbi:MAG TPA: hypothetical protein VFS83_17645 [Ktedonobacterales bacterium]|nr:hypothetical protein [Ktedonobacterales bacterium]
MDRRDRLKYPSCEVEPTDPTCDAYQLVLDAAYAHKNKKRRKLGKVFSLLMRKQHLPMSPYQRARSEYLFAEYYRELDRELDKRGVPDHARADDPLGQAANHYRQAADIARGIPDGALAAQLTALESDACFFSHPTRKRYRRAFASAQVALNTWLKLSPRESTDDMTYSFQLGDALGIRGQMVAEDAEAVRGLDHAAHMLYEVQGRPDLDPKRYANDDLFLDWDWTLLYFTMGYFRQAFKNARETRKKGRDLFESKDRARFQCLVADIVLACAEEGKIGDYFRYSPLRLLAAGERAIDEAYHWAQVCKEKGEEDRAGYAMILLAEAKWMGLSNKRSGRAAKIEQAEAIAIARNDILLLGRVEIAWGDEWAFQYGSRPTEKKLANATAHYQRAEEMLTEVEALSLARIAHWRLERLVNPPVPPQLP